LTARGQSRRGVGKAELVVADWGRIKAKSLEPPGTPAKRIHIDAFGLLDAKRTQSENQTALTRQHYVKQSRKVAETTPVLVCYPQGIEDRNTSIDHSPIWSFAV
jgi:hypothetical protein